MPQGNSQYNGTYGYQQPYNPYMNGSPQPMQGQPGPQPIPPQLSQLPPQTQQLQVPPMPNGLKIEQSYIENILRLNKGKLVTIYMTFENNREWNAKIFKGIIEAAGRDHVIISDPTTGMRYLLPMINLDYATFDEEIEYSYPFNSQSPLSTYIPR